MVTWMKFLIRYEDKLNVQNVEHKTNIFPNVQQSTKLCIDTNGEHTAYVRLRMRLSQLPRSDLLTF